MEVKELRADLMKSKRDNPERAKVLGAILNTALLIAKEDKNREVSSEDIISAAKKEIKMAQQSKDAGAPYSENTFIVAAEFLPQVMNEEELKNTILNIIKNLGQEYTPKLIGVVMKDLSINFNGKYDGKMASNILKEMTC